MRSTSIHSFISSSDFAAMIKSSPDIARIEKQNGRPNAAPGTLSTSHRATLTDPFAFFPGALKYVRVPPVNSKYLAKLTKRLPGATDSAPAIPVLPAVASLYKPT